MRAGFLFPLLMYAAGAAAQVPDGTLPPPPQEQPSIFPDFDTDYSQSEHWLCRPTKTDNPCRIPLDATVLGDGGISSEQTVLPKSAPVDCFYVYPTVSSQAGYFSDLSVAQVHRDIAAGQIARFSALCNVYAPVYRQLTLAGLSWAARHGFMRDDRSARDIRDAFLSYLAHDNKGRGIVFIGHSQGARMVTAILMEFFDGQPLQKQLVMAILAGNGDDMFGAGGVMTVTPRGRTRGGTFAEIPMCRTPGETGCIIAWSTYADGYEGPRAFGNHDKAGRLGACVSPADIGSGAGNAIAYIHSSVLPGLHILTAGALTPYVKIDQQMAIGCVYDSAGTVLRLKVRDGVHAERLRAFLEPYSRGPVNLHMLDLALMQGNLVDAAADAATRWRRK